MFRKLLVKLFMALVLMTLGATSPRIWDRAVAWWTAPTPPPSTEAQALVNSLEDGEGWKLNGEVNKCPRLCKGGDENGNGATRVVIRAWHADVYAGTIDCNSTFTTAECGAINDAAEKCLRKLITRQLAIPPRSKPKGREDAQETITIK